MRAQSALRSLASSSLPTSSTLPRLAAPAPTPWALQRRSFTPPAAPTYDARHPLPGGGPEPPSPSPNSRSAGEERARSASAEFYRAMVPSMLHCLALGSIVYYALELAYMMLAREKEGLDLREKVARLEGELEAARRGEGSEQEVREGKGRSWWKLW
ncbi:hypothetical protein JCM10449v2_006246 [Rhodotorula kratochvilovae]